MYRINVDSEGKRSVFVQKKDIKKLIDLKITAPSSIFYPFTTNQEKIDKDNEEEYIEYTDIDAMAFIVSEDFLIDYDIYNYFSEEELQLAQETLEKSLKKLEYDLSRNLEMGYNCEKLLIQIEKIKYMLDTISEFKKNKNFTTK